MKEEEEKHLTKGDNEKTFTTRTSKSQTYVMSRKVLNLEFMIDAESEEHREDVYLLTGKGDSGTYEQRKSYKDDQVKKENILTLHFTELLEDLNYTLKVEPAGAKKPYYIFENMSYEDIKQRNYTEKDEDEEQAREEEETDTEFKVGKTREPDYSSGGYEKHVENDEEGEAETGGTNKSAEDVFKP